MAQRLRPQYLEHIRLGDPRLAFNNKDPDFPPIEGEIAPVLLAPEQRPNRVDQPSRQIKRRAHECKYPNHAAGEYCHGPDDRRFRGLASCAEKGREHEIAGGRNQQAKQGANEKAKLQHRGEHAG